MNSLDSIVGPVASNRCPVKAGGGDACPGLYTGDRQILSQPGSEGGLAACPHGADGDVIQALETYRPDGAEGGVSGRRGQGR